MPYCLLSLVTMLAPAAVQQRGTSGPPQNGYWEGSFEHDLTGFVPVPERFNVVHMALVPKGPHRGHVLVWDLEGPGATNAWTQHWALVDVSTPDAPVFWNGGLELPSGGGDLFCAGHAWTSNGELLVAGGTAQYPVGGDDGHGIAGGKLLYLYDPSAGPNGTWIRQPDLAVDRWYPTVVLLDSGKLLIAGGTRGTELEDLDDYEVFTERRDAHGFARLARGARIPGPELPADALGRYPRIHQLENGEQFLSGYGGATAKMNHALAPGQWTYTASSAALDRKYVNAVLMPHRPGEPQRVMTIGGESRDQDGHPLGALDLVEACEPGAAGSPAWNWRLLRPLQHARAYSNAVLLPDGTVLVLGGRANPEEAAEEIPVLVPELFDGEHWHEMAQAGTSRSYHSTAVLLPSGKVLTGGGGTSAHDYQVFVPPYVLSRARPRILSAPETLPYSSQDPTTRSVTFAALPAGEFVDRVVLMAPGSVTHHFDPSQRYVELVVDGVTSTSVSFFGPSHAALAPRGEYMLFLVSASGIPSVASWVEVH